MYILVGLIPLVLLLAVELWSGVAGLTYDHRVRRSETPGPYWFIIALQVFCAAMVTIAALAIEIDL